MFLAFADAPREGMKAAPERTGTMAVHASVAADEPKDQTKIVRKPKP